MDFVVKCLLTGFALFVHFRMVSSSRAAARMRTTLQLHPHLREVFHDDGTLRPFYRRLQYVLTPVAIAMIWLLFKF